MCVVSICEDASSAAPKACAVLVCNKVGALRCNSDCRMSMPIDL